MMTKFYENIIELPRFFKKLIMIFFDSFLIVFALLSSFYLRLGYFYFPDNILILAILIAPIIAVPIFYSFGLYRSVTRFIGSTALVSIVQAISLYASIWGLIAFMTSIDGIPRSVILINWMLCIIIIGGSRIFTRSILKYI
jgi:FlaA1/EpsC-like NDP-sugar epimerase